ncbi:hypothetical protein CP061683_0987B, partial [Chlamydia psittaci 06-1683]
LITKHKSGKRLGSHRTTPHDSPNRSQAPCVLLQAVL